jgi:hypothetical protein
LRASCAVFGGMSQLLQLADQARQASPHDVLVLNLNYRILMALGWTSDGRDAIDPAGKRAIRVPSPATSIDDAISIVPEDMRDEIEITTLYRVARVTINMNHGPDGSPFYGENVCNSIPLAICDAAMRAIEAAA